jgi:Adenylate and Guanylate cyclase catalytic domain
MFSDLVGSTALSARMDPEDLREVISTYQKCVAEIVRPFGGFVAKYIGDGVLVYFGYPQAHEDDAEQAVRAGLELIAAVTALKSHVSLQTRVGIATGLGQDPVALLYIATALARRLDDANRAFLELKDQIQAGEPPGLIDKTVERIEGLLSAIGAGYVRAGAGYTIFPTA